MRMHVVDDGVQLHNAHVLILAARPWRLHHCRNRGVPLLVSDRVLAIHRGVRARVENIAAYVVDNVEEVGDDGNNGNEQWELA